MHDLRAKTERAKVKAKATRVMTQEIKARQERAQRAKPRRLIHVGGWSRRSHARMVIHACLNMLG